MYMNLNTLDTHNTFIQTCTPLLHFAVEEPADAF